MGKEDYKNEKKGHGFLCVPKELLFDNRYKQLTIEAILLYAYMLDRLKLSMNSLDDYSQIAKNFFLPPESERICAQTDAAKGMEKFYEIWTVKEAFVKALGHGLSRSLKSFEVLEQGTINDYTNNSRYNYYTKQLSDNYLCSLVVV